MVTCWCCLILLCLRALAVSHLHRPTLSAAFSQCRPPVHGCVWSKAYTALDLQVPALQTSQDKMWYFFNTSEYLTSTHLITLNKTTFFLLYFHYFFPSHPFPLIIPLMNLQTSAWIPEVFPLGPSHGNYLVHSVYCILFFTLQPVLPLCPHVLSLPLLFQFLKSLLVGHITEKLLKARLHLPKLSCPHTY